MDGSTSRLQHDGRSPLTSARWSGRVRLFVAATLIIVSYAIYVGIWPRPTKPVSSITIGTGSQFTGAVSAGQPECGEVCSYKGSVLPGDHSVYPQLHKHINCDNILRRMAYRNHTIAYPPPKQPPQELYDEFTQMGEMPLKGDGLYNVDFSKDRGNHPNYKEYSGKQLDDIKERLKRGENINPYNDNMCMINLLTKLNTTINGASSVVIGTLSPWLEVILLTLKAAHITTLEYGNLRIRHPDIDVYSPYTYADMALSNKVGQFDFGATFSSIEHSGLGRYGDPINPYGDLEAMAQVWCMLKPGGVFVVGVPGIDTGPGYIEWNAHRVYGLKRLQQLTANWNLVDRVSCPDGYGHVVSILKKE